MADLPRFAADASADEVAEAVRRDGCAVVERLASDDVLDALLAEVDPWLAAAAPGADEFAGRHTRRVGGLLGRAPASHALVAHPLVLGVADRVLWGPKTTFQLHLTQVIAIGPGAEAQALHRDQWCFDFFPFPDDVEVELGTMWALTDFTEANGATRVAPGTQALPEPLGLDLSRFTSATVPATMPRGSVVLYSGRTVHGGGANTTDEVRLGLNVDYVLGWLRQEENQYLAMSPEVARTLPDDLLRLAGYAQGAYALGYVDDLRDPLDVLRENPSNPGATFAPPP